MYCIKDLAYEISNSTRFLVGMFGKNLAYLMPKLGLLNIG